MRRIKCISAFFLRPLGNYWEFSYSFPSFSLVLRRPPLKKGTRTLFPFLTDLHRPPHSKLRPLYCKGISTFSKNLYENFIEIIPFNTSRMGVSIGWSHFLHYLMSEGPEDLNSPGPLLEVRGTKAPTHLDGAWLSGFLLYWPLPWAWFWESHGIT